ncbi:hypothetical protein [Streptomyces rapamycinicus]|uniref:hypothetical protein n=1 Tax=Streptomyces rapamycinicus TaxID=1226757 RepID=UPI0020CA0DC5|nr:hypothetical protein [Streptomyces rapamycinicus]UTP32077.1 hypothetical protein LIV37_23640 [Streptomyces rapamycinicus NRRL 5491]
MTARDDTTAAGAPPPGRPARPGRPADYWDRVRRIAAAAPPLTAEQRVQLRVIFHQPEARKAAA